MSLLLLCSLALADVVGPDPTNCPPGSRGTSNHSGPYCVPATCDNGCPDGESCTSTRLCILEEERPCGGMVDPGEPCTYTHIEATGACDDQSDCTGSATCVTADRCTAPSLCGCSTLGPPSLVLLLGLLPLALRRRRGKA